MTKRWFAILASHLNNLGRCQKIPRLGLYLMPIDHTPWGIAFKFKIPVMLIQIHSLNRYFLNAYCKLGIALNIGDVTVNQREPPQKYHHRFYI